MKGVGAMAKVIMGRQANGSLVENPDNHRRMYPLSEQISKVTITPLCSQRTMKDLQYFGISAKLVDKSQEK